MDQALCGQVCWYLAPYRLIRPGLCPKELTPKHGKCFERADGSLESLGGGGHLTWSRGQRESLLGRGLHCLCPLHVQLPKIRGGAPFIPLHVVIPVLSHFQAIPEQLPHPARNTGVGITVVLSPLCPLWFSVKS